MYEPMKKVVMIDFRQAYYAVREPINKEDYG